MVAEARRQLVTRRCRVCEWQGERIEAAGADTDCPWCHAPTRCVRAVALAERRRPLGVSVHARGAPPPDRADRGARALEPKAQARGRGGLGLLPRVERGPARVARHGIDLLLDAEELVVFGDAVGARGGSGLDLPAARGHGQVGDGDVFRLAAAVAQRSPRRTIALPGVAFTASHVFPACSHLDAGPGKVTRCAFTSGSDSATERT